MARKRVECNSEKILAYMRKNPKYVFTLKELADALGMRKERIVMALRRLVKMGIVERGLRGQYINPFVIYDSLKIALDYSRPSYASMEFSLSGDIYKQNIYTYTIVTTKRVKPGVRFLGNRFVEYHQISPRLFFGFREYPTGVAIAEPEKAVLDMIYFRYFKGSYSLNSLLSDLDDMFLEELDKDKLFRYAERFGARMLGFVKKLDKDGWWEHSPER